MSVAHIQNGDEVVQHEHEFLSCVKVEFAVLNRRDLRFDVIIGLFGQGGVDLDTFFVAKFEIGFFVVGKERQHCFLKGGDDAVDKPDVAVVFVVGAVKILHKFHEIATAFVEVEKQAKYERDALS